MSDLEYRSATPVDVSYQKRLVEVIVMPYNSPAEVEYRGRTIIESCSPGAWDGIEKRPGRVKANRDHDITRTIGKAITFHPSRTEGLVSEIRISATSLGDETLQLAADGILDISAGFAVMPDGEVWQTRNNRILTKCWLGHIAFTPDPAFEDAKVLSVRSRSSNTPRLDRILAEREAAKFGI